jgi:hypothetical protein
VWSRWVYLPNCSGGSHIMVVGMVESSSWAKVLRTTIQRERRTPSMPGRWAWARRITSMTEPEDLPERNGPQIPRMRASQAANSAIVGTSA